MKTFHYCLIAILALILTPSLAVAAGGTHALPGAELSIVWIIPFVCMLLSIAVMPLVVPHIWHHHFGKISLFWGLAFLVPCAIAFGAGTALYQLIHVLLVEYIPFIILLFTLFTVAGGVRLKGQLAGTPLVNVAILLVGTVLASWMGTTGAAMLLIRPLLRANAHRKYRTHSVVFFIFLVANIGGSLTPLGDPPLFLGFLRGVDFFWTTGAMLGQTAFLSALLLCIYLVLDTILFAKEGKPIPPESQGSTEQLGLDGKINLLLLLGVIGAVLLSGSWKPGVSFDVYGTPVALQNITRDLLLLGVAALSLKLTTAECRKLNGFTWEPIAEVAKLFVGIFVSMIPALAILGAGTSGALGFVINLVTDSAGQPVNTMYFWLTGLLSAFLDNAPTYVVFFQTAGGDPIKLMGEWAGTLTAISAGSVFMGAVTYIGNAPNFMVRSIAEDTGLKMPSFFGYMAWSVGILFPCFGLLTLLFY